MTLRGDEADYPEWMRDESDRWCGGCLSEADGPPRNARHVVLNGHLYSATMIAFARAAAPRPAPPQGPRLPPPDRLRHHDGHSVRHHADEGVMIGADTDTATPIPAWCRDARPTRLSPAAASLPCPAGRDINSPEADDA
jgi:hypothetical protein